MEGFEDVGAVGLEIFLYHVFYIKKILTNRIVKLKSAFSLWVIKYYISAFLVFCCRFVSLLLKNKSLLG